MPLKVALVAGNTEGGHPKGWQSLWGRFRTAQTVAALSVLWLSPLQIYTVTTTASVIVSIPTLGGLQSSAAAGEAD